MKAQCDLQQAGRKQGNRCDNKHHAEQLTDRKQAENNQAALAVIDHEVLAGCSGIFTPEAQARVFHQTGEDHNESHGKTVIRAGPGSLNQVRDANSDCRIQ